MMRPILRLSAALSWALILLMLVTPGVRGGVGGVADTPWPMFQHDVRHTGRSPLLGIGANPVEVWRTKLPWEPGGTGWGDGMSIGLDGNVYAVSDGGLYAVEPAEGAIRWKYPHEGTTYAVPTVGSDGTLYWGVGDSFAAISPAGQTLWGWRNLDGNHVFHSGSLLDTEGNIYFIHDGLWSLYPTGEMRWIVPFGDFFHGSPALGQDGTIYAMVPQRGLGAFRPNGDLKWLVDAPIDYADPVIADDGTIYVAFRMTYPPSERAGILAVNPDGTIKWRFTNSMNTMGPSTPALGPDGTIYFVDSRLDERVAWALYAVHPDGKLKWTLPMTPEPLYSPLAIDRTGRVYLCGMAGYCWGVAPDGTVLWHITMWGWQNENGQGLRGSRTAPLIVADGKMLFLDEFGMLRAYEENGAGMGLRDVFLPQIVSQ